MSSMVAVVTRRVHSFVRLPIMKSHLQCSLPITVARLNDFRSRTEKYLHSSHCLAGGKKKLGTASKWIKDKDKKKMKKAKQENAKQFSNEIEQIFDRKVKLETNPRRDREIIQEAVNQYEDGLREMKQQFERVLAAEITLRVNVRAFEELPIITENGFRPLGHLGQVIQNSPLLVSVDLARSMELIPQVRQAVANSSLNINYSQEGTTLLFPIPKVTKEHREELAKAAKSRFQTLKQSIQHKYSVCIKHVRFLSAHQTIDFLREKLDDIEELTKRYILEAERVMKLKQKELLK